MKRVIQYSLLGALGLYGLAIAGCQTVGSIANAPSADETVVAATGDAPIQQNSTTLEPSQVETVPVGSQDLGQQSSTSTQSSELTNQGQSSGASTQPNPPVSRLESSSNSNSPQPGNSQTSTSGGLTSQVRSEPIETSQATVVQEILSDLSTQNIDAQQTSEGLVVNLPENILFDFDKSDLRPSAAPALSKISQLIAQYNSAPVEIRGHTDSVGSNAYNQALSERRANAVRDYLINAGVGNNRLTAQGLGETNPVADNTNPNGSDNPEGRQQNRRVEVVIKN